LNSVASQSGLSNQLFRIGAVQSFDRWLHATPHSPVVAEVSPLHVAVARWAGKGGHLEGVAMQALPAGAVVPSPLETNIAQPDVVRSALRQVFARVDPGSAPVALLLPDPVVRVFILPFETLPRRHRDALPLLRWRLKKSVPFDMEETSISWERQASRDGKLEIVAAVARQPIVREYEALLESCGTRAGVVLSSTLSSLPLLEERGATLLARLSGRTLTTVIVLGGNLCVYRSTELQGDGAALEPKAMLDEIFPAVAYFQDTWASSIHRARLSGFGTRADVFLQALADELKIPVGSMADAEGARALEAAAKDLVPHGLDALAGWRMNRRS
jgi:type IV pilus assembly protein PilM